MLPTQYSKQWEIFRSDVFRAPLNGLAVISEINPIKRGIKFQHLDLLSYEEKEKRRGRLKTFIK